MPTITRTAPRLCRTGVTGDVALDDLGSPAPLTPQASTQEVGRQASRQASSLYSVPVPARADEEQGGEDSREERAGQAPRQGAVDPWWWVAEDDGDG